MRTMMTTLAGAGVLMLAVSAGAEAAQVQWKVEDGGNGHWYEAVYTPAGISWSDANTAALRRSADSHLVTISSEAENLFVFSLVDDPRFWWQVFGTSADGPWLGGIQLLNSDEPIGGWRWVTGETFAYTNWAPEVLIQTPAQSRTEDVLNYWNSGGLAPTWNDKIASGVPFSGERGYIVESTTRMITPIPAAAFLLAPALLGLSVLARLLGARQAD
jgi:hypothetical protein